MDIFLCIFTTLGLILSYVNFFLIYKHRSESLERDTRVLDGLIELQARQVIFHEVLKRHSRKLMLREIEGGQ